MKTTWGSSLGDSPEERAADRFLHPASLRCGRPFLLTPPRPTRPTCGRFRPGSAPGVLPLLLGNGRTRIQTLWQASGPCSGTLGIVGRRRDQAAILAAYPIATADPGVSIRIREVELQEQGLVAPVSAENSNRIHPQGPAPSPVRIHRCDPSRSGSTGVPFRLGQPCGAVC